MVKTCPICGKEFEFNHGNRKYCSVECARIKQREWDRHYYQEHKEEKRKYSRKYYQEHRKEILERGRQQRRLSYLSSGDREIKSINYKPDYECIRLGYSCLECPYEDCRYDYD